MANIGQQMRPVAERVREQNTTANQALGTGIFAPVLPNQNRDDAGQPGQQGGQGQGSGQPDDHLALANSLKDLSRTGIARTAQNLAGGTAAPTARPVLPRDSVLATLGPNGVNTFNRGTLRPSGFVPGGRFTTTQGKPLRVVGDMPAEFAEQISNERTAVALQTKPMNRDFVANGRYNVPIRV